jgi:putative FmdB family regulatory protein
VPTYQYACTSCGHQLEAVQSFSDDALTVCPACEGRLRKLYSAVGIVFKGSGFYRTDSRSASKSETSTSSETPAAASGAGKSEATSSSGSSSSESSSAGSGSKPAGDKKPAAGKKPAAAATS